MGKLYYAVVKSSLDKIAQKDGKGVPERSGEKVTLFANAQEAQAELANVMKEAQKHPVAFDFPNARQFVAQPAVIGTYTVELTDQQIAAMKDVTPGFSAGRLEGAISPDTVKDVEWTFSADAMHGMYFTSEHVPVGSTPNHAEIRGEAGLRLDAYSRLEDSLNMTYESDRNRINMRDPLTARAAEEAFSARGFMAQDPNTLPPEQAYCQQYMRMMTYDKPLNVALKTDAFHQAFNARLDMLESKFPDMAPSQLATTAMRDTIQEFQQSALTTRNLQEQQVFGEMQQMNAACTKAMLDISEQNMTNFVVQFVNEVQDRNPIGINYDELAQRAADDVEGRDMLDNGDLGDGFGDDYDDVGDLE